MALPRSDIVPWRSIHMPARFVELSSSIEEVDNTSVPGILLIPAKICRSEALCGRDRARGEFDCRGQDLTDFDRNVGVAGVYSIVCLPTDRPER
ncbi:hypothetical protein E4U30_006160 [Claviceps sp. LM220 group G6]|nr:hypothetical protein E4U15_000922 [Claviceps sp. LM218 group G6]KAG6099718.1 hypothetical protein E4U30_006160 [Claviceps sp. LM220 group G6]KAG6114262.1 hypothetical protein E4U31_005834 [Claviceps sp. LM219 group G6]